MELRLTSLTHEVGTARILDGARSTAGNQAPLTGTSATSTSSACLNFATSSSGRWSYLLAEYCSNNSCQPRESTMSRKGDRSNELTTQSESNPVSKWAYTSCSNADRTTSSCAIRLIRRQHISCAEARAHGLTDIPEMARARSATSPSRKSKVSPGGR